MAQYISVRVPWHDNGWNRTIWLAPSGNENGGLESAEIDKLIR